MPTIATGQSRVRPSSAGDLVQEVVDVVADAAGAVGAEVRQVLADLGRVDAGQLGQALRGDRGDLVLGGLEEGPVVERQAGDRRLGDSTPSVWAHQTLPLVPPAFLDRFRGYRPRERFPEVGAHFFSDFTPWHECHAAKQFGIQNHPELRAVTAGSTGGRW